MNQENTKPEQDQQQEQEENVNAEQQNEQSNESDPSASTDKMKELEEKYNALNDKYLRLYSEYDNYRKRTAKEKLELMATAGEDVFKLLLPVLDDFDRALKTVEENNNVDGFVEGIKLIQSKLKNSLTNKGLKPMDAKGEAFDPDIHDAITSVPAPSEDLKGKVVDEVEKGYLLNGKVIRHAKVVVGN